MSSLSHVQQGSLEHFRLHLLAAAHRLIEEAGRALGSHEGLLQQFPFLIGYLDEVDSLGLAPDATELDWAAKIAEWQAASTTALPLRTLALATDLDFRALLLLVSVGLVEEDGRFGALFEVLQMAPGQQRPNAGLLNAWWRPALDDGRVPRLLRHLLELGLLEESNPEAPRSLRAFSVPALVWDALRGQLAEHLGTWLRHLPHETLLADPEPIFEPALHSLLQGLPDLLQQTPIDAIIVRGPRHNGRRTLIRWLARRLGRGVLEIALTGKPELESARLRGASLLALLLRALPVVVLDLGPGETIELPRLPVRSGPLALVVGQSGGIRGIAIERSLEITIELPGPNARARHLGRVLPQPESALLELALRHRMTSGSLQRTARLAQTLASLERRSEVAASDLRRAARTLGRQALDTLATRLTDAGDWAHFAASADTLRELRVLERRCRQREQLGASAGACLARSLNPGVRALFQGPSGTGKTLAARLLAASIGKDLYRVDLSATVNKYIGETEKNLERIFSVAEELDIVLLFDEGDALLARRTGVSSSNDRYANLETNFLLQRLEAFEGVVVVTTNATEIIDTAFQRRMDVVVDFRAPEAAERYALWQLHLPPEHAVDTGLLHEVSGRCQLTGGQIKNAVLHAALLALDDGSVIGSGQLEAAVVREYRKLGGVCPLRSPSARSPGLA